jgi:peptidoglycan/xylan/chitin deacetylase (PgdA/CDA1 family)
LNRGFPFLRSIPILAAAALAITACSSIAAQTRTVALTIDDLPFVPADGTRPISPLDGKAASAANRKLLRALARHKVPVTGFVIQKSVEGLGPASGPAILRMWTRQGLDLGNHTYSHPDFNDLTVEQFEDQIARGETTLVPTMAGAGRKPEFFRFPFNHTGDTAEKHNLVAGFLAQRGYRLAPCTIENSDWMFDAAYGRVLARGDRTSAARLRADYLAFTALQIDYFSKLNAQVWGYEPPQIMLIHDNRLNAGTIEDLLSLFEKKGFRWVTLSKAELDPAYGLPETFVTRYGPMWGYRWARDRGVKVDGSLEPDPPKWIGEYGKRTFAPPRRSRSKF